MFACRDLSLSTRLTSGRTNFDVNVWINGARHLGSRSIRHSSASLAIALALY